MSENEAGVIGHLLDVERQASGLMLDAQTTADKRIAQARSKADALYKSRYDAMILEFEKKLSEHKALITRQHEQAIVDYEKKIGTVPQDVPAFNELLKKLLFKH